MEEEIMSIGEEQNLMFNRLRLFIDYYLLRNRTDRKQLTDYVSGEMSSYAKICGPNIRPITVKRRLTAEELNKKFISNNSTTELKSQLPTPDIDDHEVISLDDNDDACNEMNENNAHIDGEVMEVLVSPEDIPPSIETNEVPHSKHCKLHGKAIHKQESLLKPKAERISLPNEERLTAKKSPTIEVNRNRLSPPQGAINLSRLKLKQALCKAKDERKPVDEIRVKSPSSDTVKYIPSESNPITIVSSSSASSSSSEDMFETIDWSNESPAQTTLTKEPFLRYFGLYTHAYSDHLTKKRTVRKRRMCTSTEHRDFHYGRLDLFEKQYANKRNKRQFLYSPPATRAKKQRRAASDAEIQSVAMAESFVVKGHGLKSNASSSSSSSNGATATDKVCVKCFKRSKFFLTCRPNEPSPTTYYYFLLTDNLLECRICLGTYHATCHIGLASSSSLFDICPCCWRQQNRRQPQKRPAKKQRDTIRTYGKRHIIIFRE